MELGVSEGSQGGGEGTHPSDTEGAESTRPGDHLDHVRGEGYLLSEI